MVDISYIWCRRKRRRRRSCGHRGGDLHSVEALLFLAAARTKAARVAHHGVVEVAARAEAARGHGDEEDGDDDDGHNGTGAQAIVDPVGKMEKKNQAMLTMLKVSSMEDTQRG